MQSLSGITSACIYQLGQFPPGSVSQVWPNTQNQNETLEKTPALVHTDRLPPNFGDFSSTNENTKRKSCCSSQLPPNHALRKSVPRGLDLAGNLCLWANSPQSSWCNCLLSAFLITEYSSVTQASMQSFSLLYAAYGYVYQSRNNWRIDILFILFSNAVGLYFC